MSKRDYRTSYGDDPSLQGETAPAALDASPPSTSSSDPGGADSSSGSALSTSSAAGTSLDTPLAQLARGVVAPGGASPADIQTAAERAGGEAPRAAPKAGEGVNATVREVKHPELEAPSAATEYRVAPSAVTDVDRETFGSPPDYETLKAADTIEVQTVDENSAGIYVAGVLAQRYPTEVFVATILARGENYLKSLAADPRVQIRVKG